MPAGRGEEWVYVDLGAMCTFDRVALSWIRRAAEGSIQVSDDAANWTTVQPLSTSDDIKLGQMVKGRYVRLLLAKPSTPEGYVLSEIEVYGRGGVAPVAKPAQSMNADGRMNLGGGSWRIQRDSLVRADGAALSQPGFHDDDWVVATVPGTVLSSYYNAGALPDPNFGANQLMISDSFFHCRFLVPERVRASGDRAGRARLAEFRRGQLEGRGVSERRQAREDRRRVHAGTL